MTVQEFITGLPEKVNKSALEGLETVFHFDINGENGGQFTLSLKDGEMKATEGLEGEPKCVVSAKDENFIDLVTGKLNPMVAIMMGKVKISNQGEMLKYAKLFGFM